MGQWGDHIRDKQEGGHAIRTSHAKNLGCIVGKLTVNPDLPSQLAQGLFAKLKTFNNAARFSSGPAEQLHNKVSVHRGTSVKIFGAEGPVVQQHTAPKHSHTGFRVGECTSFPAGTAAGFLRDAKVLNIATPAPEIVKSAVSATARVVNQASEAVGLDGSNMAN